MAGEIWHLSIEDLFAQPELMSLGGSGPFVINLSVSTAPISETVRLNCAEHSAQVYQIKVFEDGRTRYRLRLGPFIHEHEADAALTAVRDHYPGALTATAGPADLQEPVASTVIEPSEEPTPVVDSTQTVRALTSIELNDRTASLSFVIQLLLTEQPPDPDAVPNLDIFSEYRLYAVAGRDQGLIKHALRLGFFADEAAAKMVAAYLASYYHNPCVVRVSGAEKERFAERRVEARKDVGATGLHAAIEITGDLVARRRMTAPA